MVGLILKDEFDAIDATFDKLSPNDLEKQLIECGLGVIHDCAESGWVMVGAKNTEPNNICEAIKKETNEN